jgi:hypothetical protein
MDGGSDCAQDTLHVHGDSTVLIIVVVVVVLLVVYLGAIGVVCIFRSFVIDYRDIYVDIV